MKKILGVSIATATLVVCAATAALAADHSTPGTPGAANCHGQTAAYVAQAAKNGLIDEAYHGIGGVGRASGMSAADWQAIIDQYCAQ